MLSVDVRLRRGAFQLDARFELPTPGVVALFGPSGCGKSTLINVIAGLLHADAGRVALRGEDLLDTGQGLCVAPERRRIGYVFQDARLFPHLSVAGNLEYARRRARGPRHLDAARITDLLDLGALLARRTQQLSGGERQRVAIARALLSQPRLLLLDEPLASLDVGRREEVLPYLEVLRDELALPMVYVSHQFDEVLRLATHIALLENGRVIAQGGIGEMSLDARLRQRVGPDAVGAVLDGEVTGSDGGALALARVRVGGGELKVPARAPGVRRRLRIQVLARDIIVSTRPPQHLSVRNSLQGVVAAVSTDEGGADLIAIDIGGQTLLARVTHEATRELGLAPGLRVWALIKAVSLRAHPYGAPPA